MMSFKYVENAVGYLSDPFLPVWMSVRSGWWGNWRCCSIVVMFGFRMAALLCKRRRWGRLLHLLQLQKGGRSGNKYRPLLHIIGRQYKELLEPRLQLPKRDISQITAQARWLLAETAAAQEPAIGWQRNTPYLSDHWTASSLRAHRCISSANSPSQKDRQNRISAHSYRSYGCILRPSGWTSYIWDISSIRGSGPGSFHRRGPRGPPSCIPYRIWRCISGTLGDLSASLRLPHGSFIWGRFWCLGYWWSASTVLAVST